MLFKNRLANSQIQRKPLGKLKPRVQKRVATLAYGAQRLSFESGSSA